MVTVKYISNIFRAEGRAEKELEFDPQKTALDYIKVSGFDYFGKKVISSSCKAVNELGNILEDKGQILIIPNIQVPVATLWAAAKIIAVIVSIASAAYSVYQAVTYKKPTTPDFGSVGSGMDESSPTYGWDGVHTINEVGIPIPVIYGEHLAGGNVINEYIYTDGDKNYLNTLIALCEGEIEDISDIKINDNPIENFANAVYTKKLGLNNQAVIPNFEDLHNIYSVNSQLTKNNPYIYTTINNDVEAFEIHFNLPSGLFMSNSDGSLVAWEVTYKVEYKLHTEGTYIDLGQTAINYKSRSAVRRVFRKDGLAAGQYDIRITRLSDNPDDTHIGDLYLQSVDEIKTADLAYPNTALLGLELLASEQLSGQSPKITCVVNGRKVSVPKVMYGGSEVAWDDYYWDPSTSQYKRFSDDAVCSWDGETYVDRYSANPVWCLRDLLTNARYGLGEFIDTTQINQAAFLEMSRYCEERVSDGDGGFEKRFRLDVVLDSESRALDIISQICSVFRGLPFYSSGAITLRIDKPDIPVQLFTEGNIVAGSLQQSFKSIKDASNVINVQFLDKANNYEQEGISVIDEASLAAGSPLRKKDIKIFTTRMSQAIREGRYALWAGKYINRSIVFKAFIDAIAVQAGDLISVAHDLPQWGFSGRVQSGSTVTKVKLDRSVTVSAGKTYKVRVQFADDTIEERTVSDGPGTYTEVSVTEAFSQAPAAYDKYAFGETNLVKKDFRVVSLRRESSLEVEITAIEYNESVFDENGIVLPTNNFSSLSLDTPPVTNITLTERLVKLGDGTIENVIDVWFRKPTLSSSVKTYEKARIYLSDNDGLSWLLKGETNGEHFAVQGDLTDLHTYKVCVVSVSYDNKENKIAGSPSSMITLIGKSAPPSNVTTFLVNQARDKLYFGWTGVADVDLSGYEIRYGETWETGDILAANLKSTNFICLNFREGNSQKYWIKAMDTSGNYSNEACLAVITIDEIPFKNVIQEYNEETTWAGTKVNTTKVGNNLEISAGYLSGTYETPARDIGYVATFKVGIETIVVDATGADAEFDDDPNRQWNDSDTGRFSGEEITGAVFFEIKTSEDNVTWSPYRPWQAGDYKCRYFQLRMTLKRSDMGKTIQCSQFYYYADLPDVDEFGFDTVSNASTGKQVIFAKTFHEEPNVHIEITSGNGIYAKFVSKDTTNFTVKLYDASGVAQTGNFDWHAHGV